MALENEEQEVVFDAPTGSWNELADQQRANAEMEQINANQNALGQYLAIEDGAKQQRLALDHEKAIVGTGLMLSAYRNGGMSDASLGPAASRAFGRQIYGGQFVKGIDIGNGPEQVFILYGGAKDPQTGRATIAPVGMIGSEGQMKVLKKSRTGDATNDLQNEILNNSYLGKLTDDQRASMGVSRPSAPISTGGAVISAAGMRALRGTPRTPSRVSWFGSDGKGGFSRGAVDRKTGEDWNEDTGTRSPDYQGRWKVLESNADGMRYENDQTGEVVNVPKGSSLRDVLRGSSERERVAQIQAQGRADAAAIRAAGRGTAGAGAGAVKVDKDLIAAVKEMRAAYAPKMQNDADEMVDNPNADPEMFRRYSDRLNQLLLGGGEGVPDGGEGMTPQQRAQSILAARRQNGGGATEPENTASTPAQGGGRAATATAARQPEVAATSESVRDEIAGGKKPSATAEKPTAQTQGNDKPVQSGGEPSKSMQLREQNAKLKGPYASIPENVLAEFRDLYPNVSDAEINSGKHDQVLRNIAKNMGDKTTAENLDARDEQRRRMDEDAERTERRAQNRAAVSEGEDRMASFRREMSAFEKSWDKSKRRMRAEGTYNEEFVKNYENRKRAEIRRKFGLKEDGSEDKTGSVTHRANRAIAAMDEK